MERSSGGIRMFRESDFEWLQVIGCMKKAGMSIRDIRQYIQLAMQGDDTIDTRLQMFHHQRQVLLDQIRESNPLLPVLLVSPIHLGDSVWKMEYDPEFCRKSVEVSKDLPQVYRQIADARRTGYLAASRYAEPSETDQEHMGKEGHRKLAEALYRAALELIQTCGDPDNIPESFCA